MQGFSDIFLYLFRFILFRANPENTADRLHYYNRKKPLQPYIFPAEDWRTAFCSSENGSKSTGTGSAAVFTVGSFGHLLIQMIDHIIDTSSYHFFAQDLVDSPQIR